MNSRLLISWRNEFWKLVALWVTVTLVWCITFNKFDRTGWETPPLYAGDTWIYGAIVKAASEGQYLPFAFKSNRYLNAPFQANWSDFPMTEDILYSAIGLWARFMGVFPAMNLFFLFACLLAATSFYVVGRHLRWRWEWCWAGALAFGASSYMFVRGVNHIALSYYWHLPLCLLVTWSAASTRGLVIRDRRYRVALFVAEATGWQNPYYTQWFLQLLLLAACAHALRRRSWARLLPAVGVAAVAMLALVSANLDTIFYRIVHGPNEGAVVRNYSAVETFSLRPVELFLPAAHQLQAFSDLTARYKSDLAMPLNEPSYLGIIGAAGFLAMCGQAILSLLRGREGRPSGLALQTFWLLASSMVGALNGCLAVGGLLLFRAQNRVSIFLLALALFFFVQRVSSLARRWPRPLSLALALLLAVVAVWDQWPVSVSDKQLATTIGEMESDRKFARRMERELPAGAMVFQLPVVKHPEDHTITNPALAYSHFRPYLFTKALRYSHGTDKGRQTNAWQDVVAALPPAEMIKALERYGFAAIYIDRIGYPAKAHDLLEAFRQAGRDNIFISNDHGLACVVVHPSETPVLPP